MSTDTATLVTEVRRALDATRLPDQPKMNVTFGDLTKAAAKLPPLPMPATAPVCLPAGDSFAQDAAFLVSIGFSVGFIDENGALLPQISDFGQKVYFSRSMLAMKIALAIGDGSGPFVGLAIPTADAVIVEGPAKYPLVTMSEVFKETLTRDMGDGVIKRLYELPLHMQKFAPRDVHWNGYRIRTGVTHQSVSYGGWSFRKSGLPRMASCPAIVREVLETGGFE